MSNSDFGLTRLVELMASKGCRRIYAKRLSKNDNKKQQIYFGTDFSVLNIFPNTGIHPDKKGAPTFKAGLSLYWIAENGNLYSAPGSQLILYPQYPEVRMSGFLKSCEKAPSELMTLHIPGRVLVLGVNDESQIIAYVAPPDSAVSRELESLKQLSKVGVFDEIPLDKTGKMRENSRLLLLNELRRIHLCRWINGKRLKPAGDCVSCNNPNCGGYTLEAELGITPNGFSEPDYLGWEIKQYSVTDFRKYLGSQPITLMTPEPTGGYYTNKGVEAFIRKFGYSDTQGRKDRLNFGGIFRIGQPAAKTGLKLIFSGYDPAKNRIVDPAGGINLVSEEMEEAASWSFASLMSHWNRKHAQAAYVPSICKINSIRQYWYGPVVGLGEGTDFLRYLQAMSSGKVYYDPGIKLENASSNPKTKRRSQFRIKSKDIPVLYAKMDWVKVLQD